MKAYLIAFIPLLISPLLQAEMYQCKNKNGEVQFSDRPCPSAISQEIIDKPKRENFQDNAFTGSIDDITTISDGLALIHKDGFGPYNLEELKEQYLSGKEFDITKVYPGLPDEPDDSHFFAIYSDSDTLYIAYGGHGYNYRVVDSSQEKIIRHKKEGSYGEHFNINKSDVNKHAVRIGLENQSKLVNIEQIEEMQWSWGNGGFDCQLNISIGKYITPHHLRYICKLEQ